MTSSFLIVIAVGYLLGSLPFGYLVARAHGVDIFKAGSKSSGATNVKRTVGTTAAVIVLALDALKGAAAAFVPGALRAMHVNLGWAPSQGEFQTMVATGLLSAIVGHSYSCFTGFRGGKGVATGAGGFAVLFPVGMGIALAIFLITVVVTRFVSLGSILAAASLPITAFMRGAPPAIFWACVAVAVLVIYRHRANVMRLVSGTEPRFGSKKEAGQ